jgi:putative glutamine amidotransferase
MIPLIGITTYSDIAQWRDWSVPAAVLPRSYVDAVRRGGGRPVLLPPGGTAAEAATTVADLDGLVVAGGGDVDPSRYGAAMHPATGAPDAERDAWELAMLDCALEAGLPLLAICRGIQLLNVVRGGTLHQHLPHVVGHEEHSGIGDDFGRHMVRIGAAGTIGRILPPNGPPANGPSANGQGANGQGAAGRGAAGFDWPAPDGHWIEVATHHHQAVDRLGAGLVATAWAADGTVEAVEFADAPGSAGPAGFAIGVQWHPEETGDPRLFRALARAAAGAPVPPPAYVWLAAAGAIRTPPVYSWSIKQPEPPLRPAGRQPSRAGRLVRYHRRGVPPGPDRQRLRGDGGAAARRHQAGRARARGPAAAGTGAGRPTRRQPGTVRDALRELAAAGYVETRRSRFGGTFVTGALARMPGPSGRGGSAYGVACLVLRSWPLSCKREDSVPVPSVSRRGAAGHAGAHVRLRSPGVEPDAGGTARPLPGGT